MKKILSFYLAISVIVVAMFSFLFYSCNTSAPASAVPERASDAINIGTVHNDGLALMFSKLQALPKTRAGKIDISRKELDALILDVAKQIVAEQGAEDEQLREIDTYLDQFLIEKVFNNDALVYAELLPAQEILIRELDAILTDDDESLTSLTNRILSVENRAKSSFAGEELEAVLAACNVTAYTIRYWHDNADLWADLLPDPGTRAFFSWKNFGRADLKGAVAAAGGGLSTYLLGFGPVGWKAWGALIVGGAVTGSIDNAIDQLWPE